MGTVLYVAAHPDDENTRLIAYLARGRGYRTGYLSLTRGDGGQDLIGPELREQLGVIRTQELLAARRIDGGRQFFTRANDFGFSKDYKETLSIWDRQQVLSDMVRVIRTFRPDILITRFSTEPGGTHGHHTTSAILALEAFKLAGDPKAFPEQLGELTPWQPKRILWNAFFGRASATTENSPGAIRLDIGGYQPLLGESFGELAARSSSMHKSQGMGNVATRGSMSDAFQVLAGDPAKNDIMEGIDTTWSRIPGGVEIAKAMDDIVSHYNSQNPAASVPALLKVRTQVNALPVDRLLTDKRTQLDRIIQECLGLYVETLVPQAEVVPGEALKLRHSVILRADFPVRWIGVRYPSTNGEVKEPSDLIANQPAVRDVSQPLPKTTPLSQPYWLREEGTVGMYRVDDPSLIGLPENPPAFPVEYLFEIGGQTVVVSDQPVYVSADPVKGEIRRKLDVIPPVSMEFSDDLALFAPGATRAVTVDVTAARPSTRGTLLPQSSHRNSLRSHSLSIAPTAGPPQSRQPRTCHTREEDWLHPRCRRHRCAEPRTHGI